MVAKYDGGAAFPRPYSVSGQKAALDRSVPEQNGMSLRDWFAGKALAATDWETALAEEFKTPNLLEASGGVDARFDALASRCYEIADAMLAAREVGD